jgi:hypothetical protein
MQISSCLTDDIAYRLLGRPLPESEGKWEVCVWTSTESDSGTKDPVMIVLYGTTGHSEPKPLNKESALNPGSFIKTQVCHFACLFFHLKMSLQPSFYFCIIIDICHGKTALECIIEFY